MPLFPFYSTFEILLPSFRACFFTKDCRRRHCQREQEEV